MKSVEESYQRRELKTFQIHESEEMKVAANRIDLNQFPHLSPSLSLSLCLTFCLPPHPLPFFPPRSHPSIHPLLRQITGGYLASPVEPGAAGREEQHHSVDHHHLGRTDV